VLEPLSAEERAQLDDFLRRMRESLVERLAEHDRR
jgi:hypothetical protein